MSARQKPMASVSLDLDNQWSYMKTHGDPGWDVYPSYLDIVVPRVLDFLRARDLSITFFVVGQDAALPQNHDVLRSIAEAGHPIGNHSFHHEPWLHLYTEAQLEEEFERSENAIEAATGQHPIGFRGPGFSCSPTVLEVLARRGYLYDASTFPTFMGPLARAYYFMNMRRELNTNEQEQRKQLFGTMRDGLRPLKPYRWALKQGTLLEIPVTTMPLSKVPIHVSYLLYLGMYSKTLALQYFKQAIRLCRWTKTPLSLLLHPLDFMGQDDIDELSFFPAMSMPHAPKVALVSDVMKLLCQFFDVVTMETHAHDLLQRSLPIRQPDFSSQAA